MPKEDCHSFLIDFDKQAEEHKYLEIEREPEEMRPVHRVITVREQKILAEAEKKRFDIPQLKLQLSAAAELALREAKLNVSNPSRNTGTYTFEDEDSTRGGFGYIRDIHHEDHQNHFRGLNLPKEKPGYKVGDQESYLGTYDQLRGSQQSHLSGAEQPTQPPSFRIGGQVRNLNTEI